MATRMIGVRTLTAFPPLDAAHRLALALLLLLHVAAVFCLIPPHAIFRQEPMVGADQPVHAYNVYMYRQAALETGLPWGYDPALSAGKWMSPLIDTGGRPQAVLHLIFGFLSPGLVVRLFAFLAALTFPIWPILVARCLGFPPAARVWSLFILLAVAWLYPTFTGFFRWGQAAFATASYMACFVLVLCLSFFAEPTVRRYLGALAGLSVLFLCHVLAPLVIALPLLFYTLFARPLSWRWRTAAVLAPVAVIAMNAFWFVPFCLALTTPSPPGRPLDWMPSDLTYRSWGELVAVLSPLRVAVIIAGVTLASFGLVLLRRHAGLRVTVAFAMAAFFGLFLKLFGSFLPAIYLMQPSRFILPAVVLLTFPAALGANVICARLRLPQLPAMGLLATLLISAGLFLPKPQDGTLVHVNYAGITEERSSSFALSLPGPIPWMPVLDPLIAFIKERTHPEDRLLLQTVIQAEPLIIPLTTGREVVANTYPDAHDFPQFRMTTLFGRPIREWSGEECNAMLERWGIQWVFTHTAKAGALLEQATGTAGEELGRYRVFRSAQSHGRFLRGKGRVVARVNRLELSDIETEDGYIILRYRYHPAWQASDGLLVLRHLVPEDPVGFIALQNPPRAVTLRFNPWRMLHASWPSPTDATSQRVP